MNQRISALVVRELSKIYEGKKRFVALDKVSFWVSQGEVVGLLGPNGAGKSTTIQMLLGTLKPTSGDIEYFGRSLKDRRSEILQEVGYASGYSQLPWNLTVMENLDIHGRLYGLAGAQRRRRIEKFLKFFGVFGHRHKLAHKLSAGEATRVMLVKAFLGYPRMVLLDEPTAALDPDVCQEVRAFIRQQRREYGVTMIYTSHNMAEVSEICDRVIFLKEGKIVAVDTPQRLAATVSSSRVKLFVEHDREIVQKFLCSRGVQSEIGDRWIEISIDDRCIGELMGELASRGVRFSGMEMKKPSLEDFFLRISSQGGDYEVT